MTNTAPPRGRRVLAVLGAFALAGVGVLAAATPAQAAPDDFGNIDPARASSIIVHKHKHQTGTSVTGAPDGSTPIPSDPLENVRFTAYPLLRNGGAIDLTVPEAWNDLSGLSVNAACTAVSGGTGYSIGSSIGSATTNASGLGTISLSGIGAYVVCETDAPPTVTDRAIPFIVTVPYRYDNGWVYNVHVYPKNGTSAVGKTVSPQGANALTLGSVVRFPVTVTVPAMAAGNSFTSFDVVDGLDPRLTLTAADGVGPGVASVTLNGTPVNPALYTVDAAGQQVTVRFAVADPAVQTLLRSSANQDLVVTFQGTVNAVGDGVIRNTAAGFVNDPGHTHGITSTEVRSNWGDVKILKTDSASPATPLEGAEFQVYEAATPYPATAAECASAIATGAGPLSVAGQTTFTTNDLGLAVIPGLFVSDSVRAPVDGAFRCYVVVETRAPAGFVTPAAPGNARGVAVTTGQTASHDLTLTNVQQVLPQLPLTGAGGTLLLTVVGVVLIGAGAGVVLVARKRRHRAV